MKRPYVFGVLGIAAVLAPAPAQAAALDLGLLAVGAAVAFSAKQQPYEAWYYTDKYGWVGGAREHVSTVDAPLRAKPGTSQRVVSACRDHLKRNAVRYDLTSLEAVSAGTQVRTNGNIVAPIEVRAIYKIQGVHEVKRSTVRCEVDREWRVISTS